ncbi:nicotinate-nucleotide adenylyltransferase [Pseudoalteromonas sp. MMG010]|uniref:nicotinate-nucleotide adenylyltransferase n=1 Tax=Pseudoalteromonas sp. MMG010 TaxID=2822685 RepID=UPI001B3A3F81|nr:nicotinate-nucleotide adenylyltransferase [Pseudoalteromonas sp. MMG010]MBQ4831680.1 nicotinate-nucleotide adenylyltransferase [Pseudoalteromonas sp. MMG010]
MIAIFGGTFNPVHLGHLNMAKRCVAKFNLSTLYFMPCAIPAHKAAPGISNTHRIEMLRQATASYPYFKLDLRELQRSGPSYSLLSLQELRAEHPTMPILFLIGMDSFTSLANWYEWQQVTSLCHIVVYQRPGQPCEVSDELAEYFNKAQTNDIASLQKTLAGKLYFLSGEQHPAASSLIRSELKKGDNRSELLCPSVSQYIAQHKLYQSDD